MGLEVASSRDYWTDFQPHPPEPGYLGSQHHRQDYRKGTFMKVHILTKEVDGERGFAILGVFNSHKDALDKAESLEDEDANWHGSQEYHWWDTKYGNAYVVEGVELS